MGIRLKVLRAMICGVRGQRRSRGQAVLGISALLGFMMMAGACSSAGRSTGVVGAGATGTSISPPTTQVTHALPPGSRYLGSYSSAIPADDLPESHVSLAPPAQTQSAVISWESAAEVCQICYAGNAVDVYLADASSTSMGVFNGQQALHGQLVYVVTQYPGSRCGVGGALPVGTTTSTEPVSCHDIDFVDATTGLLLTSESY
jgi:hypothetical protein